MATPDITVLRARCTALEDRLATDEAFIAELQARPAPVDHSAAIADLAARVAAIEGELANPL